MSRLLTRIVTVSILLAAGNVEAQQWWRRLAVAPSFLGPDAVENQLRSDTRHWGDWKKELEVNHALTFGFDYTAVFLSANDTSTNDTAAGGIARAYGVVSLTKSGSLVVKVEHRHEFGEPAPADLALNELGYVGQEERPFVHRNFGTQNLYWRQRMNNGRSMLMVGVLDPTDYVDAFALSSPWLHFMNSAFSNGSATIGLPNDAAFGIVYGSKVGDGLYFTTGITDINGDPDEPFRGLDNFVTDNEYFASFELGWSAAREQLMLNNIHLTAWHKDAQETTQTSAGHGVAFSVSGYVSPNLVPFIRGGYSKNGGTLLQKSLSIGLGYQTEAFDGFVGAAVNWGDPNEHTFAQGLQDQYAVELFYRLPVGRRLAVTGDLQYIKDPALNPSQNTLWMFNLRARMAF